MLKLREKKLLFDQVVNVYPLNFIRIVFFFFKNTNILIQLFITFILKTHFFSSF